MDNIRSDTSYIRSCTIFQNFLEFQSRLNEAKRVKSPLFIVNQPRDLSQKFSRPSESVLKPTPRKPSTRFTKKFHPRFPFSRGWSHRRRITEEATKLSEKTGVSTVETIVYDNSWPLAAVRVATPSWASLAGTTEWRAYLRSGGINKPCPRTRWWRPPFDRKGWNSPLHAIRLLDNTNNRPAADHVRPTTSPTLFFLYPATPFIVLSPSGNRLWAYREKENFRSSMVVEFQDWRKIVWIVIGNWGESIVEDGTKISKERGRKSLWQIVSNDRYLQSGVCQTRCL